jgi:hypothetical protein
MGTASFQTAPQLQSARCRAEEVVAAAHMTAAADDIPAARTPLVAERIVGQAVVRIGQAAARTPLVAERIVGQAVVRIGQAAGWRTRVSKLLLAAALRNC